MNENTKIRFLYKIEDIDYEFEVIKRYGSGWLCHILSGPRLGDLFVFEIETIKLGQHRLKISQRSLTA